MNNKAPDQCGCTCHLPGHGIYGKCTACEHNHQFDDLYFTMDELVEHGFIEEDELNDTPTRTIKKTSDRSDSDKQKAKESAKIEPVGEPCQVKSDAFCLVEFTDTNKYLARISNNPVGWIDELHIYATSNQSAIDTLTAENKRLREYLDRIFDGFGTLSRYELEELIRELKDETKGE